MTRELQITISSYVLSGLAFSDTENILRQHLWNSLAERCKTHNFHFQNSKKLFSYQLKVLDSTVTRHCSVFMSMHTFVFITTTVAYICHKLTIMLLFCPFHFDDVFCALLPEVKATWSETELRFFSLKETASLKFSSTRMETFLLFTLLLCFISKQCFINKLPSAFKTKRNVCACSKTKHVSLYEP